ncbi:hypothetical protein DL93DRAFT_2233865 [Clavulina sp. PMI_390]|nr:hypothetical protein DL93DRAFT_2233865 [Clavulina sp. PMI_390]
MDHLPAEIIAEIFLCGIESLPTTRFRHSLRFRLAVSATWRAVALSTPRLWSQIILDPYNLENMSGMRQIQRWTEPIQTAIQRSANTSLTIRVYTSRSQVQLLLTLWDIIIPALERCSFLQIVGHYSTLNEIFPIQQCCPRLQELSIHPKAQTSAPPPSLLFSSIPSTHKSTFITFAPILQRIFLGNVCQASFLSSIPSSALLGVTIRLPPVNNDITWECLANFFLPCADTLQTLHIDGGPPLPPFPSNGSPILFKRLTSFSTDWELFPRYIAAPMLNRLACIGNAYRFSDKDIAPEWLTSADNVSIRELALSSLTHSHFQSYGWLPSSLLEHVETLSLPFSLEIVPHLLRMASETSAELLFPQAQFLRMRAKPSSMKRHDFLEVVESIKGLLQARPALRVGIMKYDGWSELKASIPADLLNRIDMLTEWRDTPSLVPLKQA